MLVSAQHPIRREIARTAMARNIFGRYSTEERQSLRTVEFRKDEVLAQLKEAWEKVTIDKGYYADPYSKALGFIRGINYSAKDVENFSIALAEFQGPDYFGAKAGYFLSALINNGTENEYVIHTNHLAEKIHLLGFENTKNIVVEGDLGEKTGVRMKGGNILVKGNVEKSLGQWMTGGKIVIDGDATRFIGDEMTGGEIHLNGNYVFIAPPICIHGGRIFHKGKLIFDK